MFKIRKVCNAPHPDNVRPYHEEILCDRPKGHDEFHLATVNMDGRKVKVSWYNK